MKKNPNIQTDYGEVKEDSLEALRDSYDTAQLIRAVDHIDTVRHHIDSIRENMLKLHTASMDLISEAHDVPNSSSKVGGDIAGFAYELDDLLFDCTDALEKAQESVTPLTELAPVLDWDYED